MDVRERVDPTLFLIGSVSSAIGYASLYEFNSWLFARASFSEHISWVFLPAAVRMLAVLLFGWAGVVGLFIGSIAVIQPILETDPVRAVVLALLSSLPSLVAARLVQSALAVPATLSGITGRQLLLFALAGGLANSLLHTLYFAWRSSSVATLEGFVPMFVGDTLGSLLLLYAAALALRLVKPAPRAD